MTDYDVRYQISFKCRKSERTAEVLGDHVFLHALHMCATFSRCEESYVRAYAAETRVR